jgi:type IV pilus assembly protein PilB
VRGVVAKGKFSDDDLRRMQAYILGIPFINLKGQTLDRDILNLIPEPIARKHNIVSFQKKDDSLEVAMLDTDDLQRRLKFIQGKSDRMKRLSSRDEEEVRSIEHILNEYESGYQEWKRRKL